MSYSHIYYTFLSLSLLARYQVAIQRGQILSQGLEFEFEERLFDLREVVGVIVDDFTEEITDFVGSENITIFKVFLQPEHQFLDQPFLDALK